MVNKTTSSRWVQSQRMGTSGAGAAFLEPAHQIQRCSDEMIQSFSDAKPQWSVLAYIGMYLLGV